MTNLQELIETTNKLSQNLEKAANEEKRFCVEIQMALERMSWEMIRHASDLQAIKSYS